MLNVLSRRSFRGVLREESLIRVSVRVINPGVCCSFVFKVEGVGVGVG